MTQASLQYWTGLWLTVAARCTLVYVLAGCLSLTLLRHRPAWRSFVWLITLASFVWLPILEWTVGQRPAGVALVQACSASLLSWAWQAYLLTTLILLGLVVHAAIRLRLIQSYASYLPVDLSLPDQHGSSAVRHLLQQVGLYCTGQLEVPTAFGILRPVILLPVPIVGTIYRHFVRAALIHEFITILRFDALWTLLARLLQCAFFAHPLVWLAYHHYCRAREEACDRWTVRTTDDVLDYELHLAALAGTAPAHMLMSIDTPMRGLDARAVRRRVQRLQNEDRPESVRAWPGTAALTASLLLLAVIASLPLASPIPETGWALHRQPLWVGMSCAAAAGVGLTAVIVVARSRRPYLTPPVDGLAGRSHQTIADCVERVAREWESLQVVLEGTLQRLIPVLLVAAALVATISLWLMVSTGEQWDPMRSIDEVRPHDHAQPWR